MIVTFHKLNFKDLLDSHRILYYNKILEELIFETVVKSLKTAKFIVLETFT